MLQHANHRTGLKPNVSRRQRRRSSFYRHFAVSMPSNDCRGHCGVSGLIRELQYHLVPSRIRVTAYHHHVRSHPQSGLNTGSERSVLFPVHWVRLARFAVRTRSTRQTLWLRRALPSTLTRYRQP